MRHLASFAFVALSLVASPLSAQPRPDQNTADGRRGGAPPRAEGLTSAELRTAITSAQTQLTQCLDGSRTAATVRARVDRAGVLTVSVDGIARGRDRTAQSCIENVVRQQVQPLLARPPRSSASASVRVEAPRAVRGPNQGGPDRGGPNQGGPNQARR